MADAPTFTDRDIERIRQSLPDGLDPLRLELLPRILGEWAATDLPHYLPMPTAKERRDCVKRLKAVASSSAQLIKALEAIADHDDQFWIIREIIAVAGLRLTDAQRHMSEKQFDETRDYLRKLSAASIAAERFWKRDRGQPPNDAASLVLMDVVAIYEWLTGRKATRQVDRVDGADSGPFWTFAAALWPPVFGKGDGGLSAAIKNWASAKKKKLKGTHSPLLANIALRHPGWGIFKS